MVWRKLLAGLGLGGVEADTVLTPTPGVPGGTLAGQVNLRVKSDTDIASITLILVANGQQGEIELARQQVSGALSLPCFFFAVSLWRSSRKVEDPQ